MLSAPLSGQTSAHLNGWTLRYATNDKIYSWIKNFENDNAYNSHCSYTSYFKTWSKDISTLQNQK